MVRSKILAILRQQQGKSVSGAELGRQLQISRTAVSKQVQKLRQAGYDIESTVSQGHRLMALPDLLRPEEVRSRLTTKVLGQELVYFSEIGSTNDEAKKRAVDGCPEGTLIITETQVGGRGRLSRGWFSPVAKGIWFSVVLRPPFPPQEAPKCTLMAAVALNQAIRDVTGVPCGIKWPNDILCNGRKLVGILTEMSAEMDAINHIVIGMGVNVNFLAEEIPSDLQEKATSLQIETGFPVSRIDLFVRILERLEELYLAVKTDGFSSVLAAWRQENITLNQMVTVIAPDKTYTGKAIDIDTDGALLVATAGGIEKVLAGDVSIRPLVEDGK
jgi:BirA family biotin operon repressor/biotin-[acetyl-CoA-carboxylase] ligase